MYDLKILSDPKQQNDWVEIPPPSRIGDLVSGRNIIVFTHEGLRRHIEVPKVIEKPDYTIDQWLDVLDKWNAPLGEASIEHHHVHYHELGLVDTIISKAKLGWNPDADLVDSFKTDVLIQTEESTTSRLYTIGGFLSLNNISRYGTHIIGARPILEAGHNTIGYWDFSELADVEFLPFKTFQISEFNEDGFTYTYPIEDGDDADQVSYLWSFAGHIRGVLDPVVSSNNGRLHFPITKDEWLRTVLETIHLYGIDYNIRKSGTAYRVDDIINLPRLRSVLTHPSSFMIKIRHPNVDFRLTSLDKIDPHVFVPPCDVNTPLRCSNGLCPEYHRILNVEGCLYKIPAMEVPNFKFLHWYQSDVEMINIDTDPYQRTRPITCQRLWISTKTIKTQ